MNNVDNWIEVPILYPVEVELIDIVNVILIYCGKAFDNIVMCILDK